MADHELEVEGKVGMPELWGFAANLRVRYKAAWGSRNSFVFDTAAERAGLEPGELAAQLSEDENDAVRDVGWKVMTRAIEVSDPEYLAALGKLLGSALDDAQVDAVGYAVAELARLEPIHLRVLSLAWEYLRVGDGGQVETCKPDEATDGRPRVPFDLTQMMMLGGVPDYALVQQVASRLVGVALLDHVGHMPDGQVPTFQLTSWGAAVLAMLFPNAVFLRMLDDVLPVVQLPV